jgi:DNA invertase Pin-like site-specific DNA recombinase
MKVVAYYRVSTDRQSRSGLGLDAQRVAVQGFIDASGGWPPVSEFTETESGRKVDRPQLAAALAACRVHRAVLVIAKLDRLSRVIRRTV